MFLTQAELKQLTGYTQPKRQADYLFKMGIHYTPDRWGKPQVWASLLDGLSGSGSSSSKVVSGEFYLPENQS